MAANRSADVLGRRQEMKTSNAVQISGVVTLTSPLHRVKEEFAKDIWDARVIPGARYMEYSSNHLVNFTQIPLPFRPLIKQYLQYLISSDLTLVVCNHNLRGFRTFFSFLSERSPLSRELVSLSAQDIDAYLQYLKMTPDACGKERSQVQKSRYLSSLDRFLRYLQRIESPAAPRLPVDKIIWFEHKIPQLASNRSALKLIPKTVLDQLDEKLHLLRPKYIPVILLLRASGWRISDILTLRHDSCLERNERGWFLCGDIHKMRVLGHRVPITDEIAAVVQAQRELTTRRFSDQDNPQRYLFPATNHADTGLSLKRAGRPMSDRAIRKALKYFMHAHQICDENGEIFALKTHAFRHTKAIELLNNGLPLIYVQQWAHALPEMTLVYARILDETMQRKWEEAVAQGVVQIKDNGAPAKVQPEELLQGNELALAYVRTNLDAIRLPNGYCFKPKTMDCPAATTPCYTCRAFVTTPAFLPLLEQEIRDLEAAGRSHWVEANRRKLIKLTPITDLLRTGQIHQPMEKHKREYAHPEDEKLATSLQEKKA
jgi:site-specific recombinase XerD